MTLGRPTRNLVTDALRAVLGESAGWAGRACVALGAVARGATAAARRGEVTSSYAAGTISIGHSYIASTDLYAMNAVVHARANDDLVPVRLKMEAMLRSRWDAVLDFQNGPPGLFPAVWLFTENCVSIAIAVHEGRMLKQGATGLLLDMVNAAVDRMVRLLDRSPDGRPLSQVGAPSTSDANG
jgi:hypothetical protein